MAKTSLCVVLLLSLILFIYVLPVKNIKNFIIHNHFIITILRKFLNVSCFYSWKIIFHSSALVYVWVKWEGAEQHWWLRGQAEESGEPRESLGPGNDPAGARKPLTVVWCRNKGQGSPCSTSFIFRNVMRVSMYMEVLKLKSLTQIFLSCMFLKPCWLCRRSWIHFLFAVFHRRKQSWTAVYTTPSWYSQPRTTAGSLRMFSCSSARKLRLGI